MNLFAAITNSQASEAPRLGPSLLRAFLLSALALFLGFKFIFPGYFHPFAALHADMYTMVAETVGKWSPVTCWHWPRPVLMLAACVAGEFGFEGSLFIFSLVALLDFALLLAVFEVYYVRRRIPLLTSLLALVAGVCAPCYYIYYNFDLGSVLAMLFGLLGILVIEQGRGTLGWFRLLSFAAICLLSALTKESYIPALCLYGVFLTLKNWRHSKTYAALIFLPVLAAAFSVYHSAQVGSPFVNVSAEAVDPYHISVAPSDLWLTTQYYFQPPTQTGLRGDPAAVWSALIFKWPCPTVSRPVDFGRVLADTLSAAAQPPVPLLLVVAHVLLVSTAALGRDTRKHRRLPRLPSPWLLESVGARPDRPPADRPQHSYQHH